MVGDKYGTGAKPRGAGHRPFWFTVSLTRIWFTVSLTDGR